MSNESVCVGIFGEMGVGKTYLAQHDFYLDAIKRNQRVYTTVSSLFKDECIQATSELTKIPPETIKGLLFKLPRDKAQLLAKGMFPDPIDWDLADENPDYVAPECFVKPGSFIYLDESLTLLNKMLPEPFMRYLTEQRHGVDEFGNVGRTLIIAQSTKVHAHVRDILSEAYYLSKYKALAPIMPILKLFRLGGDFRCEVYTDMSVSIGKGKPQSRRGYTYDKRIFSTYKSHQEAQAEEKKVKSSASITGNSYITMFIPIMLIIGGIGSYVMFNKFKKSIFGDETKAISAAQSSPKTTPPLTPVASMAPAFKDKTGKFYVGSYTIEHGERVFLIYDAETRRFIKYAPTEVTLTYTRYEEFVSINGKKLLPYHKSLLGDNSNDKPPEKPANTSAISLYGNSTANPTASQPQTSTASNPLTSGIATATGSSKK